VKRETANSDTIEPLRGAATNVDLEGEKPANLATRCEARLG